MTLQKGPAVSKGQSIHHYLLELLETYRVHCTTNCGHFFAQQIINIFVLLPAVIALNPNGGAIHALMRLIRRRRLRGVSDAKTPTLKNEARFRDARNNFHCVSVRQKRIWSKQDVKNVEHLQKCPACSCQRNSTTVWP